ncbi:MAG: ATP-dependent DNA helicase [bacterium]|jgi:DNA helicase II / ATP-dependent DNA helicase PcrA|nr:ATP-dependent DNA helicase [bacterium]
MSDVDLLSTLNLEQQAAVTHVEGPLMIIAGAGTGKTTAITHRIAWLIDQGHAKPEEILALTFTDKAAAEMEERVDRLLPYGYVDLQISTFHSFAETLLRKYGAEVGLSRDFRLMNELDAWLLTRQHLDRFDLDYYRPLGNPTKYIRSLLIHFSRAKDSAIDPEMYLAYVENMKSDLDPANADEETLAEIDRLDELARAYQTYQQLLLDHDALDFGDLMLYTLKLLRERPAIRKEIRDQYRYVLVDEFQDTNDAQYEIVKEIAAPRNNLTMVGDDDQSIYKFRGASLANILRFEEDYPDATRVVLTTNYRSAQEILDYAHGFIQHNNPNRLEANPDRNLSKKLKAGVDTYTASISHIHGRTLTEEVSEVVKRIKELKSSGDEIHWSDFAILVRSNNAGTDFAASLEQHGVPYQFLALSGLYTKPVILDLLAYLRCIDNPFDSASFYRLLTSPLCGVSERGIMELNRFARRKGKSLFEACEKAAMISDLSPEDGDIIRTVLHNLTEFQSQARNRKVNELFVLVAKESGYLEYLNTKIEQEKLESFGYLQQFHERLKSFVRRHDHPVLHHFLQEFDHERDAGEEGSLSVDLEAGPDVVKIMTIHASKGLEFRHVFVVNMVSQRFPTRAKSDAIPLPVGMSTQDNTKEGHLEEERRLFYVAMTRAKEGLYFTSASDYGGARKRKISRFLHELGYEQPADQIEEVVELFDEEHGPDARIIDPDAPVTFAVPKQFSFTQLAAFRSCPLQYKFAHVLKIPVMGKWTFSYGKTMHNTLQRFFELWLERVGRRQVSLFDGADHEERDVPVTYPELLEIFDKSWIDEWYVSDAQREKYRTQSKESLKAFYATLPDDKPTPLSIEQGFTLKLGTIVLKGRIDRMDTFEDGVEIIDYKTGKPKTKLSSDDKEQLLLYQLAARDVLGLNVKKLTFHYLKDNSKVSFLGTDTQLLNLQDSIVDRVQQIKDSSFLPTPGFHCRFCDFSDICEFRQ